MRSESIIAVQALLDNGKEAELRFRASLMRQEGGALSLWDRPEPGGPERMIMAFAPAAWRGAWLVDPQTSLPVGLEPKSAPVSARSASDSASTPASAPASVAAPAPPEAKPAIAGSSDQAWPESYQPAPAAPASPSVIETPSVPEPASAPAASPADGVVEGGKAPDSDPRQTAWAAADRDQRSELVAQALSEAPYEGVLPLAERLGVSAHEAEQALTFALAQRRVDFQHVQDPALQSLMDQVNPELIQTHRPKKPAEILELLRKRDDTAAVDLVQLRVWLLRNPPKRPA